MSNAGLYAEEGLLSGIIKEPSIITEVIPHITSDDFSEPRYSTIYSAIAELFSEGKQPSLLNIGTKLREMGQLSNVGGFETLSALIDPTAPYAVDADVLTYADIVQEESIRRRLWSMSTATQNMAHPDSGVSINEVVAYNNATLIDIAARANTGNTIAKGSDMIDLMEEKINERASVTTGVQGVPTGFYDLDRATTGFQPGNLVIVAARPAVGKSTLAVDFLRNASIKAGMTAMMFSLEMSKNELMDRILAAEANIKLDTIRSGHLAQEDWTRFSEAKERIKESNFILDDSALANVEYIKSAAIKQKESPEGLHLIIVDYLQLMTSGKRVESRQQEVSEFSRGLKLMAKELGVPVVALSQLNRGSENRTEKRPKMSDLRESGSIEQDADIVILLHRENSDLPGSEQTLMLLEKNRNGATATIPLSALLAYAKFGNASGQFPSESAEGVYSDELPPDDYEEPPFDIEPQEAIQAPQEAYNVSVPSRTNEGPAFHDPVESNDGQFPVAPAF